MQLDRIPETTLSRYGHEKQRPSHRRRQRRDRGRLRLLPLPLGVEGDGRGPRKVRHRLLARQLRLRLPQPRLPLAAPGAVWAALKTLFQPNGPLSIKPRFDPALWAWLHRFACHCNHHDMLEAGWAIQALLDSSCRLYDELLREETIDCEWESRGLLLVFQSSAAMQHYAEANKLLSDQFNLPATRLDGGKLTELEPA